MEKAYFASCSKRPRGTDTSGTRISNACCITDSITSILSVFNIPIWRNSYNSE